MLVCFSKRKHQIFLRGSTNYGGVGIEADQIYQASVNVDTPISLSHVKYLDSGMEL